MKKVLITGVYGLVAGAIYKHLQTMPDKFELFGLGRRRFQSDRVSDEEAIDIPEDHFFLSDMSDRELLVEAFQGIDTLVHMAAAPHANHGWEAVLNSNISGGYNVLEACRMAGVKRIIYASSIQVSMGYLQDEPYNSVARGDYQGKAEVPRVNTHMRVRPQNHYAASKAFGEALCRAYADSEGLSSLCLRIGWVNTGDTLPTPEHNHLWCSQKDIARLTECCIDAPDDLRYGIYHGISDNFGRWIDLEEERKVLGWKPMEGKKDLVNP